MNRAEDVVFSSGGVIEGRESRAAVHTLQVAYTPDSDDAFNYYAWEHGRVTLPGCAPVCSRDHIIALNRAALLRQYDVVAISSAFYPRVADAYAVLAVGNSVGRGYGPVLVSKNYHELAELRGKRVAVAGMPTTGGALAAMYCPGAELIEAPYNQIADAIVAGQFAAGVMIHEELLFFPKKGLHSVRDLGAAWCEDTGLPLPVGLNVVRRDLGDALNRRIAGVCRDSLEWGLAHFAEAFAFASQFGRGCGEQHVEMFSNQDTLRLADDVRAALEIMCARVADLDLGPRLGAIEVIDA